MNRICVNDELLLSCPEGFAVMSADEPNRLYACGDSHRWGAWDRERHVMLTVLWQRYNPLLMMLADMKSLARRNEQLTQRGYEGHDYQLKGFSSRKVCGLTAEGYRFTYRLGDVIQSVETVLIKRKNRVYSLNCIGREADQAGNHVLFEAVLDGIGMK